MDLPLLQTKNWQKLQKDLGKTTFFEQNNNFTCLAILETTPLGNYLYCPYGPVADNLINFKKALNYLHELAAKHSVFFVRIEPQNLNFFQFLQKPSKIFKKIQKSTDLNPKYTWVLSLLDDEDTIIKNFSPSTRNLSRQFKNKGISVEISQNYSDIKYLIDFQKDIAKNKKFNTFSAEYLRTELKQDFATLYLAKYQNKVIAASLFFDSQDTRYYMQSASDPAFKKLPATIAILSTAIFDAKAKNLQKMDFWGIAPSDASPSHPWFGFTKFKKSFGGQEICYAGTHDLILKPAKYRLYQAIRKINLLRRRIF